MGYKKKTLLLIIIATLIRCITAYSIELGNDEVYYRMYAQQLQWNYFDHPPMVGWLVRLTTFNLFFDTEFFIRLGAIISSAIATWLMFLSGKKLVNEHTGFVAALMYTACIYTSVIAGIFILPDSPQVVCWMGGLYLLICITESKTIASKKTGWLFWFGVIAGLGMLCKIHTVFLWLGFGLYILLYNRQWLRKPALYISALISLLFFYPVIKWNIDNHFITFLYHGNRVNIAESGINIDDFFTFFGGQVFYTNPIIFVCVIIGLIAAFKNNIPVALSQKRMLLLTGIPLIIIATIISFFKPVLPHWTGPGFCSLILLTAAYFTRTPKKQGAVRRVIPIAVMAANILLLVILIGGVLSISFFPGTLGKKDALQKGDGDFTLDMYGWKKMSKTFKGIYEKDHAAPSKTVIVSNKWFPASHIDLYIARPLKIDVFVAGPLEDIHQYHWLNDQNKLNADSCDIYAIIPSNNYFSVKDIHLLKNREPVSVDTVSQKRSGEEVRKFYIYHFPKDKYVFKEE